MANEPRDLTAEGLLAEIVWRTRQCARNNDEAARRGALKAADRLQKILEANPVRTIRTDTVAGRITCAPWVDRTRYEPGCYCHCEGRVYQSALTTQDNHPARTRVWVPITEVRE